MLIAELSLSKKENHCYSLMQAALDVVLPYVHERHQFGVPIGHFQVTIKAAKSLFLDSIKLCMFLYI